MFVSDNLEISVIAVAKTFSQEIVNENHLIIASCDFLCKHKEDRCTILLKSAAQNARNFENSYSGTGFKTPIIPSQLLLRIKHCNSIDDVKSLAEELVNNVNLTEEIESISQPNKDSKIGDFHIPNGPNVGTLPKIISNKDTAARIIQPFLIREEFYVWDGPYNTKDHGLVTRPGQSMGRLFITNKRLLFWSDDVAKPHVGLFYEDIQEWKTSWMPMKSRGVIIFVGGRKVIFAANSTAIENAERYIQR
jgi:hypothetical protein